MSTADLEALAAWKAELSRRRELAIDPAQEAAARRAANRARIIGNGDTWTRQAVAYENAMVEAPPKADPTETTKRWRTARDSGIAGGGR